jgi:hypothetical protein
MGALLATGLVLQDGLPGTGQLAFLQAPSKDTTGTRVCQGLWKKSLVTQQNLLEKIPNCHKFTTGLIKRQMGFKNSVK